MTALAKEIKRRGIKQKELADKLGISPAAVCLQIQTGIQMAKVASRYAKAIGCEPHILMDFHIEQDNAEPKKLFSRNHT